MKVLLLEKIKKLGGIGDSVIVKDGYARNYLFTRKKALRFTKENQEKFQAEKETIEKANAERKKLAQNNFKKVDGKIITTIKQAADDGKLYGSVSNKDITKLLVEKFQIKISVEDIILVEKIKDIGSHDFMVSLHSDIEAKLKIIVARSEEEAKNAIKQEKDEIKTNAKVDDSKDVKHKKKSKDDVEKDNNENSSKNNKKD